MNRLSSAMAAAAVAVAELLDDDDPQMRFKAARAVIESRRPLAAE